jgi:hypothetical protein
MKKVTKAMKMEDDMDRIILLLPGKAKAASVVHSCSVADKKYGECMEPRLHPSLCKAQDRKLGSMLESFL